MKVSRRSCLATLAIAPMACRHSRATRPQSGENTVNETVTLPAPGTASSLTIEQTLARRRSIRSFANVPLTLEQLSQLLWAAQGVSHSLGFRTTPSAGALYPLEIYLLAGTVTGLAQGVYKYRADGHNLVQTGGGDLRADTASAAFGQSWIAEGAAIMVIAAVFRRTEIKYGARAERYVHMEAGHAAQNVYLEAVAQGLGTTVVGAFDDDRIHTLIGMEKDEAPLSLLPIGQPST